MSSTSNLHKILFCNDLILWSKFTRQNLSGLCRWRGIRCTHKIARATALESVWGDLVPTDLVKDLLR